MPAYLGQHFLADEPTVRSIVDACEIAAGDTVVEIGPGRGVLTRHLVQRHGRLVAVELDRALVERLTRDFPSSDRFRLVHADFLKWDLDKELAGASSIKFVGNLPYSVASPILQKVLAWPGFRLAVFMFQKEVALRLVAKPGSKEYGILTLAADLHALVDWIADVGREKFRPPPTVDSAVLRFRKKPSPLPPDVTGVAVLRVAKAAFSQRRKQVVNPLAHALSLDKTEVLKALDAVGIPPTARAEELTLAQFAALARRLVSGRARRL